MQEEWTDVNDLDEINLVSTKDVYQALATKVDDDKEFLVATQQKADRSTTMSGSYLEMTTILQYVDCVEKARNYGC